MRGATYRSGAEKRGRIYNKMQASQDWPDNAREIIERRGQPATEAELLDHELEMRFNEDHAIGHQPEAFDVGEKENIQRKQIGLGREKTKAPSHVIERRVAGRVRNMKKEQLVYMLDQIKAEKEKADNKADKKFRGNIIHFSDLIKYYKDENRALEDEIGSLIKNKADKSLIREKEARHSQVLSKLNFVARDLEAARFGKERFSRQEMEESLEQQFSGKDNFDIWQEAIMAELRTRKTGRQELRQRDRKTRIEEKADAIEQMGQETAGSYAEAEARGYRQDREDELTWQEYEEIARKPTEGLPEEENWDEEGPEEEVDFMEEMIRMAKENERNREDKEAA
ncbi:hypothetical protein KKC88_04520 [Patescibacteria group bacterium]|nr:hypothetical protein [Patescibacteria group bacterium]MBU1673995.1 hypothetical protein [Patescibacteria group bacterium]MBU1962932.1 hypothetical protein [Patescibacteria group bacterium]